MITWPISRHFRLNSSVKCSNPPQNVPNHIFWGRSFLSSFLFMHESGFTDSYLWSFPGTYIPYPLPFSLTDVQRCVCLWFHFFLSKNNQLLLLLMRSRRIIICTPLYNLDLIWTLYDFDLPGDDQEFSLCLGVKLERKEVSTQPWGGCCYQH